VERRWEKNRILILLHLTVKANPTGNYTTLPETLITQLPDGYQLAFSPFAPAGPSVLNPAAWERYQTFTTQPQPLTQTIDHEFAAQHLIISTNTPPQVLPQRTDTLTVWLHLTNACPLACLYCYVQQSSARMEEATGKDVLEQVFKTAQQHQFRRLKLKYAGGEATLQFKLIRRLHDYAHQLAVKTNITVEEVILSNGIAIRPNLADWLARTNVKLMISIDGVGEVHDQQRPLKQGGSSFARLEHTLTTVLLPRGLQPSLSITITQRNALGVADVVKWALAYDLPFTLNFYRTPPHQVARQDLALAETTLIAGMKAAYQVIETHLPTRPLLNGLLDKLQTPLHTHTCGVGQNYLVITPTGQVSQCQMQLNSPVSDHLDANTVLPLLTTGTLRNLSVEDKNGCRHCTYRYRCTGGCPLESYQRTGRWDVPSLNCTIYKILYPEALRLEGLRLMKRSGLL
jgi:uncharacterized protein